MSTKAYDDLRIYFGDSYSPCDAITIRHPRINDIVEMGEKEYYSTVFALTAISSDMKSVLWDEIMYLSTWCNP